jgi:uncharacterized protein (TIGR02996 family)
VSPVQIPARRGSLFIEEGKAITRDEAFLQAILEAPEDDTPRLVYADYLEERGDPRGEFIRVQCALANESEDSPRLQQLRAREEELLEAHRAAWLAPLGLPERDCVFHRGFVDEVQLGLAEFVARGVELVSRTPLRRLRLAHSSNADEGHTGEAGRRLSACPALARLELLDLYVAALGPEGLRSLFASPYLAGLRHLHLGDEDSTPAVAEELAASPLLPRLESLALWGFQDSDLGDTGVRTLVSSPGVAGLKTLDLMHNRIRAEGAQAVAASPWLTGLTALYLGRSACGYTTNDIGPQGARALAGAANLAGLTTLGLDLNHIGAKGLAALAGSRFLTRLRCLGLRGNAVGPAGVRALAESPNLRSIEVLSLGANDIGDEGAVALGRSPFAGGLRTLWLVGNRIGDRGVATLARSATLAGLRDLHLGANPFGKAGVQALIQSPHLAGLKVLRLTGTKLADADTQKLRERFGDRVEF